MESESSAVNCHHSYPLFLASLSPPSPDLFFRKTHVFFCAKVHYAPRGGKENPGLTTRRSPLCVSVASRKSSGKLNNVGRDLRESTEHEELSTAGFPTSNDGKIETTPSKDRVRSCETQWRIENTFLFLGRVRFPELTETAAASCLSHFGESSMEPFGFKNSLNEFCARSDSW